MFYKTDKSKKEMSNIKTEKGREKYLFLLSSLSSMSLFLTIISLYRKDWALFLLSVPILYLYAEKSWHELNAK